MFSWIRKAARNPAYDALAGQYEVEIVPCPTIENSDKCLFRVRLGGDVVDTGYRQSAWDAKRSARQVVSAHKRMRLVKGESSTFRV